MNYQKLLKKYILEHEDYRDNKLSSLDIGRLSSFADWLSAQQVVQRTPLKVRILNAICYGMTAGSLFWLLFGGR